jgi:hypothetical protein
MLTLRDAVKEHLRTRPFLEEALNEGLINISALSRMLKDDIEESLGESVNEGAIIMAIKRMEISVDLKVKHKLSAYLKSLGDTVVRSGLVDYTVKNSATLLKSQANFLSEISEENIGFNAISRGVNETTIVISKSSEEMLLRCFKNEVIAQKRDNLASITLQLPDTNNQIYGVYYFLFKSLAEWGINVIEVISTTNEVSIIVDDSDIERTFSVLNRLKK